MARPVHLFKLVFAHLVITCHSLPTPHDTDCVRTHIHNGQRWALLRHTHAQEGGPPLPVGLSGVRKIDFPSSPPILTPFFAAFFPNFSHALFFSNVSCVFSFCFSAHFSFFLRRFSFSRSSSAAVSFRFVVVVGIVEEADGVGTGEDVASSGATTASSGRRQAGGNVVGVE